jgi:hypothetical protein
VRPLTEILIPSTPTARRLGERRKVAELERLKGNSPQP